MYLNFCSDFNIYVKSYFGMRIHTGSRLLHCCEFDTDPTSLLHYHSAPAVFTDV